MMLRNPANLFYPLEFVPKPLRNDPGKMQRSGLRRARMNGGQ